MNKQQTQIRNWRILRLRGAWAVCNHMDIPDACKAIDAKLEAMGAEPEGPRRKRMHEEWQQSLAKLEDAAS